MANRTLDETDRQTRGQPDARPEAVATVSRRLSPMQLLAVTRERLLWNHRADTWDDAGSAGLSKVVEAVLEACQPAPDTVAIDLGCGSGQVTIPVARACRRMVAVDVSGPLIARLERKARDASVDNITTVVAALERLDLAAGSVDLVVSNYALHHLRDADKAALLRRAHSWLRPGGRLVIGDMMFGRGLDAENRQIVGSKARSMLSRGPAGWWRLVKNVWRFSLRLGEKPLPIERWEALARAAGFAGISTRRVVSEACVLTASRPMDTPAGAAG